MQKRGVSELVATVLIVLVTIAAVGLIAGAIVPMIKDNFAAGQKCQLAQISVNKDYSCYDSSSNGIKLVVSRGSGEVEISGIQIKIISKDGSSKAESILSVGLYSFLSGPVVIPGKNSDSSFTIDLNKLNISNADKVAVIPMVKIGNKDKTCEISAETKISNCITNLNFTSFISPVCGQGDTAGIISYWRFNENSGTTADDLLNANPGTIIGASRTAGKIGGAYDLDGIDDYVNLGTTAIGANFANSTVAAWVKLTTATDYNCVYGEGWTGNAYPFYHIEISAGKPSFAYRGNNDPYVVAQSANTINDGLWHYVVGVRELSDTLKIYVDGTYSASGIYAGAGGKDKPPVLSGTWDRIRIGSRLNWPYIQWFNGTIDEVAVWNRSLTADEIADIYSRSSQGNPYCTK